MIRRSNDTDPAAPPEMTDPGGRADTEPQALPAFGKETEIDPLLKAFDRTPVPPAPQPAQRASSEGGSFVAHYAVLRPAAAHPIASERRASNVEIGRELGALLDAVKQDSEPPRNEGFVAARLETTFVTPQRRARRQRAVWLVTLLSGACTALILIALLRAEAGSRTAEQRAPSSATQPPNATSMALPVPNIAPLASSVRVSPEPLAPPPQAVSAVPAKQVVRAASTPTKSAPSAARRSSTSSADDEFERVLPR